jgi:hypothetical protein
MKLSPPTALDILIQACERRLGPNAPVAEQLRRLRAERSEAAFERARTSFDRLPGALRTDLAGDARRLATDRRRAALDRVAQRFGLVSVLNRRR